MQYYHNVKQQNKPLKFITSKLLIRTKLAKFFKIQRINFKVRFYPNSELSRKIWIDGNWEGEVEKFTADYLKMNDVLIDIGANIGLVTLDAAVKIGSSGKVYSIEPHPTTFEYLLGNIKLNNLNNIHPINAALGNKTGKIIFTNMRSDCMNFVQNDNKGGLSVPISKLDDLTINELSISLMKIDVEGYEKFVLEGGKSVLKKTMCIFYESLDRLYKKYNYTHKDIFQLLTNEGFQIYRMRNETISLLEDDELFEKDKNLIAIRDLNDFVKRTNYKIRKIEENE